jgi:hypothetical protein
LLIVTPEGIVWYNVSFFLFPEFLLDPQVDQRVRGHVEGSRLGLVPEFLQIKRVPESFELAAGRGL